MNEVMTDYMASKWIQASAVGAEMSGMRFGSVKSEMVRVTDGWVVRFSVDILDYPRVEKFVEVVREHGFGVEKLSQREVYTRYMVVVI